MKSIIFGYKEGTYEIKAYEYIEDKFYSWQLKESNYAIVRTSEGLRLIKVVGYGELKEGVTIINGSVVDMYTLKDVEEKEESKNEEDQNESKC